MLFANNGYHIVTELYHRVTLSCKSFKEAWAVQCGVEGFGGMEKVEESFVEKVERYEDDEGDEE